MEKDIKNSEIKYVAIYASYIEAIEDLEDMDRLIIYESLLRYGFYGIEPEFTNKYLKMAWKLIKPNLDNNIKRQSILTENAKKGGRPKKDSLNNEETTSKEEIVSKPKPSSIYKKDYSTESKPIESNNNLKEEPKAKEETKIVEEEPKAKEIAKEEPKPKEEEPIKQKSFKEELDEMDSYEDDLTDDDFEDDEIEAITASTVEIDRIETETSPYKNDFESDGLIIRRNISPKQFQESGYSKIFLDFQSKLDDKNKFKLGTIIITLNDNLYFFQPSIANRIQDLYLNKKTSLKNITNPNELIELVLKA